MDATRISINASAICWRLAWVAIALVVVNMALQSYLLFSHREHVVGQILLNLDKENNVPALFSTTLLLLASQVLVFLAILERKYGSPDASRWALLAFGFLAMALDEALALHERLIEPVRNLIGPAGGGHHLGIFYFTWVIPGIVLVSVLGAFFLPFLLRLPRATSRMLIGAGSIYLGGALGLELLEGWWREAHGPTNLAYHAMVSLEEGMEMIGVIALIRAVMDYAAHRYGEVAVTLDASRHVAGPVVDRKSTPPAGSVLGRSAIE